MRKLRVFSRHKSHDVLRRDRMFLPELTLIRLGSTTKGTLNYRCEINSIEGVRNSSSKLLMKRKFRDAGICTPDWWTFDGSKFTFLDLTQKYSFEELPYPIVAKHFFGSRGTGNFKIDTPEKLKEFISNRDYTKYLFEKFYSFNKEYRLHITKEGCFYTCRKMLKQDTPEDKRWFRNDSNCSWIVEENPMFDKPSNWSTIIEHCVKGLEAVGLDVSAFDVKVQSKEDPKFIVIECNSAPSFGEITTKKYKEQILKIFKSKTS